MNAFATSVMSSKKWDQEGEPIRERLFESCDMERALVVDDEAAIVKLFGKIIAMEIPGLKVDLASNGLEAVDSFRSRHQAVLLMDVNMPVMDGQAAIHEIEKMCKEKQWNMPAVVFCTGYAPPDLVKEVVGGGSRHGLLLKPPSYEAVVAAVRQRLYQAVA